VANSIIPAPAWHFGKSLSSTLIAALSRPVLVPCGAADAMAIKPAREISVIFILML
jgi:hypothetical protein